MKCEIVIFFYPQSPDRGQLHSSVVEDPRYLLGDMMDKTLTPMTSQEGGITETDVSRDLSEVKQALMRHDMWVKKKRYGYT